MLHKFVKATGLVALCACLSSTNAHVVQRSQTVDAARNLVGWTHEINRFDVGDFYGAFAITPEYTQSFNRKKIARSIFGSAFISNDCSKKCDSECGTIAIQGSTVPNRSNTALLADYFGMAPDFDGTVTVCPKIQNFLIDFNLFLGLDNWLCGAWFRVQAPLVYAKWKLDFCQAGVGTDGYPAGYFGPTAVANSSLNQSFSSYLQGGVPDLGTVVTFNPLNNSKLCTSGSNGNNGSCGISFCKNGDCKDTFRLSDIEFALGWNFWQDEDYHVGLGVVVRAPTGNRVNETFLFQPIVGNGHHWELGGLFTSHWTFWNGCDGDQSLGIYVDAWITHLFKAGQCRSFDLCCRGPLSRYMLAEEMTTNVVDDLAGEVAGVFTSSTYQFNNVFSPVANYTFQKVDVSIPVQADVVAMLNYTHCNFSWDIGYNFWGTSCEKIRPCKNVFNNKLIALKGDAWVYGFEPVGVEPVTFFPVPLGATETGDCSVPQATIFAGTNNGSVVNAGIENPQPAVAGVTPLLNAPSLTGLQTNTSIQSQLLTNNDVDYAGARRKGLTHKVFTNISYSWEDCGCYVPFLGIGGFAEFAQGRHGCCDDDCDSPCIATSPSCVAACSKNSCDFSTACSNGAFSQWGIWLKGGFAF